MAATARRDIQSLARGLDVLTMLVNADHPMGVTEIAQKLDLDKSTVYRLLSTLVGSNFVVQDSETRRYMPGLQIIALSRKVIDKIELRSVSKPFLKQLKDQTGETSHIAIMVGGKAFSIDYVESSASLSVQSEIGNEVPFHCTSIGKALIAHYSPAEIEEFFKTRELTRYTPRTITSLRELIPHLETVKERGYALDDEEYNPDVRCVASPIRDHRDKVVASVGISGPAIRVTTEKVAGLAVYVIETAKQISRLLGHV